MLAAAPADAPWRAGMAERLERLDVLMRANRSAGDTPGCACIAGQQAPVLSAAAFMTKELASDERSARTRRRTDHPRAKVKLAIGAIGVVFGDIGTSPLYAFRETFASHNGAPGIQVDPVHIEGVLSLVFWSMMIVVTFKYVLTIMRADNKGEGGSLALLALINRKTEGARWTAPLVLLGVFATALFYGDSMITPAMSVLSATEGLKYVQPGFRAR